MSAVRAVVPRDAANPQVLDVAEAVRDAAPAALDVVAVPQREHLHLERVASLGRERVYAVGAGRLYRLGETGWERVLIEGAAARDVLAHRSSIWVLAEGTGANAGHALVLRANPPPEQGVRLVEVVSLRSDGVPKSLAVVREGEYFIGGSNPPLVHVLSHTATPVEQVQHDVVAVRRLRDETVVAMRSDGKVSILRWGEHSETEVETYLDTIVDPSGFGFVVHTDGSIVEGRPGREMSAVTGPAPFVVRAAAVLPTGYIAVVGRTGPVAMWRSHTWSVVDVVLPSDPVSIAGTDPPIVIGRSGYVVELTPGAPRTIVP